MAQLYRIRHEVKIVCSLDAAEKKIGFERNDTATVQTVRSDLTEGHAETRAVDDGATDEALAFGGVGPAKLMYMETDQPITFKLNGGTEVFQLTPATGGTAKVLWEGNFTAISISNASGAAACVTYVVAG